MPLISPALRPLRIVLPGGSGQVGRMLAAYFQERGHHVTVLTRLPYAQVWQTVRWDGETVGPWTEYLEGADVCINLTGRSVNCRYTHANRAAIYASRVRSTRLLGGVIGALADPPKVWLNASSATIYRHALDRPMDEASGELGGDELSNGEGSGGIGSSTSMSSQRRVPRSWNFSIQVVKDWEAAFFAAPTPLTRKVALRSAITFSPVNGNAFALLLNLVRFGFGGTQGNGRQFVSWIHEADFARAIEFLMRRDDIEGAVNVCSPNPLPNREFMAVLREASGIPNGLPAPAALIELAAVVLRTESELVLKSRRVVPGRLLDAGFRFEFPAWPEAADDLVYRWRHRYD